MEIRHHRRINCASDLAGYPAGKFAVKARMDTEERRLLSSSAGGAVINNARRATAANMAYCNKAMRQAPPLLYRHRAAIDHRFRHRRRTAMVHFLACYQDILNVKSVRRKDTALSG